MNRNNARKAIPGSRYLTPVTPARTRGKGLAPPTPKTPRYQRSHSVDRRSPNGLSLKAMFDDLGRDSAVLMENVETKFLEFIGDIRNWRKRWMNAEMECQRLQVELTSMVNSMTGKDRLLKDARRLCDEERTLRQVAEKERDSLKNQIELIREMLLKDSGSGNTLNNETRERIRMLGVNRHTSSSHLNSHATKGGDNLDAISELMESTGSILDASDLSFDETRDLSRPYKRRTRSGGQIIDVDAPKKRRKSRSTGTALDASKGEKLVATTTVTVDQEGRARAESQLEAKSMSPTGEELERLVRKSRKSRERRVTYNERAMEAEYEPSAPPCPSNEYRASPVVRTPNTGVKRTFSNAGSIPNRPHRFQQKLAKFNDKCGPCDTRIKFSKEIYKCVDCRAACHPTCRDKVPLPCISMGARTPVGKSGLISDYTPLEAPMIPALIIHCVREVEDRGLSTPGIYRVSGSHGEVSALLEKFQRSNNVPRLADVRDIHAVTSCIKRFLHSLKEPLIPNSVAQIFVDAASNPDTTDAEAAMIQAVSELPQPNRDTLAFLMLHFQLVASSSETLMPTDSLAKVFGPTLLGFYNVDVNPHLLTENQIQVVRVLLELPSDYWSKFVNVQDENMYIDNYQQQPYFPSVFAKKSPAATPTVGGSAVARRTRASRQLQMQKSKKNFFQSPMLF